MTYLTDLWRHLRHRFQAWRTERVIATLSVAQRKDIGYPTAEHWIGQDPRPVMRHYTATGTPVAAPLPATGRADTMPPLKKAS